MKTENTKATIQLCFVTVAGAREIGELISFSTRAEAREMAQRIILSADGHDLTAIELHQGGEVIEIIRAEPRT